MSLLDDHPQPWLLVYCTNIEGLNDILVQVWEALWNETTPVAVKMLKASGEMQRDEFLKEASIMGKMRHPKLLQLYAVCSSSAPMLMVCELMRGGSLQNYLGRQQTRQLPTAQLLPMAVQVAAGMTYLEEHSFAHCDLRAANVLIHELPASESQAATVICKVEPHVVQKPFWVF